MMAFIGWILMFATEVAQALFMVYLCALVMMVVEDQKKGE